MWLVDDDEALAGGGDDDQELDDEPVYWCSRCKSLRVVSCDLPGITEYCADCGGTEMERGTIYEWFAVSPGSPKVFRRPSRRRATE
jgi:hypothetical protein